MELTVTVGFITGIVSFFMAYFTFMKNRDKDTKSDASKAAIIETKLDAISLGVEQIRFEFKTSEQKIAAIAENAIRLEESTSSAHKRIDKLERVQEKQQEQIQILKQ